MTYPSSDMCSLALRIYAKDESKLVHIHNIYNPFPISYTSTNSPSTIPAAKIAIEAEGEHILLGDFNLHHPYWSGPSRPTSHAAANQLLELVEEKNLSLTLPKGTITWEARNSYSTIDLVFMTSELAKQLEHCKSREDIGQSSDHIPILTHLCLGSKILPIIKHRAFKLLNMDKLREVEQIIPPSLGLHSHNNIETYIESIQTYLQNIIKAAIP